MNDESIHDLAVTLYNFCTASKLSEEKKIILIEAKIKETIKIIKEEK
jgi:hypothetical protein